MGTKVEQSLFYVRYSVFVTREVSCESIMAEAGKGWFVLGFMILLLVIYLASIFLPRQRCPHCKFCFSLPKQVDQKGDRERVQCRWCDQVWERFHTEAVWTPPLVEAMEGLAVGRDNRKAHAI